MSSLLWGHVCTLCTVDGSQLCDHLQPSLVATQPPVDYEFITEEALVAAVRRSERAA